MQKAFHQLQRKRLLHEDGKIDYRALKPVLFEVPTYEYLRTGDVIGKCISFGKGARNGIRQVLEGEKNGYWNHATSEYRYH